MGKKRRLIKKCNKFTGKHSTHPVLKRINSETQLNESEVADVVKEPVVKIEKTEKPVKEVKVQAKPQPIVAAQSKITTKVKKTVTKKATPKVTAKNKTTKRVKKTKPTTDKAI